MNIYEKILTIMSEVSYLSKDDSIEFGKTKYKALSEEKVTSIMRKQMIDKQLLVYPIEQSSSRDNNISHVDVTYRIVNVENPDEYIDVKSCGDGYDTQDKGAGKAMTYAFKYMWLRTFAIPTGEDPDKISSDEIDAQIAESKAKDTSKSPISEVKINALISKCESDNVDIAKLLLLYKLSDLMDMNEKQYSNAINNWDKVKESCGN